MKNKLKQILQHPLLLSLYFPSFLAFFATGLLGAVTPLFMASFEVDYSTIGVMLSMATIGKMLLELPGGILIPRIGVKNSMVLGSGVMGIFTIAMFFAKTPQAVILYQFLIGIGGAFYNTARFTFAAAATTNENRGRYLSALGGTNRLSRIISPALGGIIGNLFGLRIPFLISGAIILISAVVMTITVKGHAIQPRTTNSSVKIMWKVFVQNRDVLWRSGLGAILLSTVRIAQFTLIPLFASDVLGLDAGQVGIILSISSVADLLNAYSAGKLMDQFGRRFAAIPCIGVMAVSMAILPFTTGFWGLLAVGVISGLGNGFGSGIMMTFGSDLAPPANREEFLSIWTLMLDVGSFACPMIVGSISDALSLAASGFAFFGIGTIGVLVYLFIVPETKKQTKPLKQTSPSEQA